MEQLYSNANVVIRMKGLGILHYNENTKLWESILIRGVESHNLKIIVRKFDSNGNKMSRDVYLIDENTQKIEIATNNTYQSDAERPNPFYKNDPFNYEPDNDIKDYRWIINLNEELHNRLPVKLRRKNGSDGKPVKLTFVTFSDATLYTAERYKPNQKYTLINKNTHVAVKERVMASWSGMDIIWKGDAASTAIKILGDKDIPLLNDNAVARYEIEINNDCSGTRSFNAHEAEESLTVNLAESSTETFSEDFHFYYDYLVDMNEVFDEVTSGFVGTLPININSIAELNNANVRFSLQQIKTLDEDFGGKTNDCGHLYCSNLDSINSLEELLA